MYRASHLSRLATLAFLLILGPSAVVAAPLDFLFTTSGDGNLGDTVSGELFGLQNGTNQDPTTIEITQAPASLGLNASVATPYTLVVATYLTTNTGGTIQTSTSAGVYGFTISLVGGVETITTPLNLAFENSGGNGIGFNFYSSALGGTGYNGAMFNGVDDYSQTGFAGTTFTAVPEPQAWSLWILLGVAGLIAARKVRVAHWKHRAIGLR